MIDDILAQYYGAQDGFIHKNAVIFKVDSKKVLDLNFSDTGNIKD